MKQLIPLAILLLPALASAQGYPGTDRHNPPPSSEVNTLEGQIVKVGEKNEYLYSYPKFNISLNPVSAMYESYSLSGAYAVGSNLAIRADVSYHSMDDDFTGMSFSVGLPIYFKKVYSGFFLEPGVVKDFMGRSNISGPQVLAGMHYMFDSGLNVAVAAGLGRNVDKSNETDEFGYERSAPEMFPTGYFRVGYAFD